MGGYDIGCSFETTVKKSSLGPDFITKNSRFCVPAFHGYTHNHVCQLKFHPNIIEGLGIEDFETLERVFSATNELARVVRYASPYRRRLLIETFLRQWDEDKYLNLGTFMLGNYTQAIKILTDDAYLLQQSLSYHNITPAMIDEWLKEELLFFAQLGDEADEDIHRIAYVEALQKLQELAKKKDQANTRFLSYDPGDGAYAQQAAKTKKIEAERRHASEQFERVSLNIHELEVALGIDRSERWTPLTPAYQDTIKYLRERTYQKSLLKLQRLVVQRLFELHKLNVAQTSKFPLLHLCIAYLIVFSRLQDADVYC
jgi:hypothetical protein